MTKKKGLPPADELEVGDVFVCEEPKDVFFPHKEKLEVVVDHNGNKKFRSKIPGVAGETIFGVFSIVTLSQGTEFAKEEEKDLWE